MKEIVVHDFLTVLSDRLVMAFFHVQIWMQYLSTTHFKIILIVT